MATFQIYCPFCEKKVTAGPLLSGNKLQLALDLNADIEVMHISDNGDHRWNLVRNEKEILRNALAEGLTPGGRLRIAGGTTLPGHPKSVANSRQQNRPTLLPLLAARD
jgi:hypothetical protein